MKTMGIPYVTHCMDEGYQLITIQGTGDTLIHIVPSKTLRKHLLKQKKQDKVYQNQSHKCYTIHTINEWNYVLWNIKPC